MSSLELLPGASPGLVEGLHQQGFDEVEDVANATETSLAQVDGVGRVTAAVLANGAEFVLEHDHHPADTLVDELAASRQYLVETVETMAQYGIPPTDAVESLRRLLEPNRRSQLLDVDGVGPVRAHYLLEAGYESPAEIANSSPRELERVTYTGPETSDQIHRGAERYLLGSE